MTLSAVLFASLVASTVVGAEGPVAKKDPVPVRAIVLEWEAESGRAVIEHLRAEIPEMKTETSSRSLEAAEILERRSGREAVILLDLAAARITAVRPDQQTVITRVFAPNTGFDAPYSFAVATLELIDIAAERRPAPPPPPPPVPASWALGLLAGPAFVAGFGSDPSLIQLGLGADLVFRSAGRAAWWAVGPRARLLGRTSKELTIGSERFALSYGRQDFALRGAAGLSFGAVDLGLSVSGGFSLADSEIGAPGQAAGESTNTTLGFFGPGLEARAELGAGFGLSLAVDLPLTFEPVQYLVRDEVVLEDGRVRTVVSLLLGWRSGVGD